MSISNIDKAYLSRNVILASIVLSGLLWVYLLNFKVPLKVDLSVSNGEVKKISPIIRSGNINGYQLTLGEDSYVIKWLDFAIDDQRLNKIANKKDVSILYEPSFLGMSNEIYEISIGKEIIFSYDFFVFNYLKSESKKLAAMPYLLLFCFFSLALNQFLIYKTKAKGV